MFCGILPFLFFGRKAAFSTCLSDGITIEPRPSFVNRNFSFYLKQIANYCFHFGNPARRKTTGAALWLSKKCVAKPAKRPKCHEKPGPRMRTNACRARLNACLIEMKHAPSRQNGARRPWFYGAALQAKELHAFFAAGAGVLPCVSFAVLAPCRLKKSRAPGPASFSAPTGNRGSSSKKMMSLRLAASPSAKMAALANNFTAGLFHQAFNGLQRFAGGDNVVHHCHLLPFKSRASLPSRHRVCAFWVVMDTTSSVRGWLIYGFTLLRATM